jgi:hypothetical protein
MVRPISKEQQTKIRGEVKKGKSRYKIAAELGISYRTVYNYTDDFPKRKRRQLSAEAKEKIRKEVKAGDSKYQVAKDFNLSPTRVCKLTEDLPNHPRGNEGIRGNSLRLLKELLEKGYVTSSDSGTAVYLHTLRKHFPSIQRSEINGKRIFFLNGKDKVALAKFLEQSKPRVISYHKLSQITKTFGVALSKGEKDQIIAKSPSKKKSKLQRPTDDFLLENEDSLPELFIRNNWIQTILFQVLN